MSDVQNDGGKAPVAIAWSAVVAIGGGFSCGWLISQLGELGSLSLAVCGGLAGYLGRTIIGRASKTAGICQAVGVCIAFLIAETCWLHWNTRNGESSWQAAMKLWPLFLREYTSSALIAAAAAAYGACLAYSYAASPSANARQPADSIAPPP